jgi:D-alanyl-lipoteichoic acid acyltransferase DltB (MBOAT superfamily)
VAFNSVQFAALLAVTLGCYWWGPAGARRWVLLVSSYAFYAYADWRFCGLLALTTVVTYAAGRLMTAVRDEATRAVIRTTAVIANLVVLVEFKYLDFFVDGFTELAESLGFHGPDWTLRLILPVGLSFYVFQAISYVIDVHRREYEPTESPLTFAVYMAYFPKMLAGPIERARHLVPQVERLPSRLRTGQALEGVELVVIGLFKKVAVADVMLRVVVDVYAPIDLGATNGWSTLLLSLPAFGVQIYCDFSGYSDIARGVSKFFGIELNRNFLRPKNSRTVLEFWQRWHVTFTRFIRDYLLRPLGGFHGSDAVLMRNAVIVFGLTGLWHGARWPLILWGLSLGVAVGVALILNERRRAARLAARGPRTARPGPTAGSSPGSTTTAVLAPARRRRGLNLTDVRKRAQVLLLLLLSTPLFVAPTLEQAWRVYEGILTLTPGPVEWHHVITVAYGVLMVVLIDRHQQTFEVDEDRRARARRLDREDEATDVSLLSSWAWQWRTASMVLAIVVFGANIQAAEFYYFQF